MSGVVVVVGNPRPSSRTAVAAAELGRRIAAGGEAAVIDLAGLAPAMFDQESETVAEAVAQVRAAQILVVASPTYKATYTGLLKAFLDRFGADSLRGISAVPMMIAAAPQHAMAVEVMMRPLLVELGASVPTRGLFLQESQLADLGPVLDAWCSANLQFLPLSARRRATT